MTLSSFTHSTPYELLKHIKIIMVGTTLPANIGSAARSMHTMSLQKLTIVNPKRPIDDSSIANAAGAQTVLQNAQITQNIHQALEDCTLIFAASARSRHIPRPVVTPNQASTLIYQHLQLNDSLNCQIAILFGREDRGLTNEELSLADYHIQIPANPNYPVLNVAAAIQVISADLYAYFSQKAQNFTDKSAKNTLPIITRTDWDVPAINFQQKQLLEQHLTQLLIDLNLARDNELKDLPNRLSRLTSRMQLDQKEYALIQALIAKLSL